LNRDPPSKPLKYGLARGIYVGDKPAGAFLASPVPITWADSH